MRTPDGLSPQLRVLVVPWHRPERPPGPLMARTRAEIDSACRSDCRFASVASRLCASQLWGSASGVAARSSAG